jgi:dolichol-phosphate mannosyltransferase
MTRPIRFGVVGALGIVVNSLVLFLLTDGAGLHYLASALFASVASTTHNFILTERWVFAGRRPAAGVAWRLAAFAALTVVTLAARVPVLYLLTDGVGLHYLVSNLAAIALLFGARYTVSNVWIWAGRDRRVQVSLDGWFNYEVQGSVRIRSQVELPELAVFNLDHAVEPDLVIRRRPGLGGLPRRRRAMHVSGDRASYREHLGSLGVAFDVGMGEMVTIETNWLLAWSQHVLYTNVVEPVLRFMLAARGYVLLHCASVAAADGATLISAPTDTGKTSTVLRLLQAGDWAYLGDDMALITPGGEVLSYSKPMTLSAHTLGVLDAHGEGPIDRLMLRLRGAVHSRSGRAIGHALARTNIPIVSINALVQLIVPPPKYHVQSLVECESIERAVISSVVVLQIGPQAVVRLTVEEAVTALLLNTEDAYTFPPFDALAGVFTHRGLTVPELRRREAEVLAGALVGASISRVMLPQRGWYEAVSSTLTPSEA